MDAARGVLQRRVRACISRPGVLSGRVIFPSLLLSSSLSSSSSSISTRSSPRTTVSPLRGGALREGRGLPAPVMAGAGASYSTSAGASEGQEQEQTQVQISQGEDAEHVHGGLKALLEKGWVLDGAGMGIQKTFYFRSYFKAVSFVNVVASQSAIKKHHPTMTVRIGSVDVHWTTHNPRGLSSKDIGMAQHCEDGAQLMGAVAEAQGKKCSLPSVTLLGTPSHEREA
ncbi:4a-hydroxytetrahydrobiopterin dehydratase [Aspergillus novofumigatus IBT 16806]|uniref:4a-hydroxytetrahydrobiopterin dehydratase n=1 Tax=Aspergillus novofumigatus (strain IBT 16806) TaxID=1392255 RepID=A0A2I1CN45_ASPN1|nr:transcriptional coactivator/pterin dehydratase [Aspergillus novofumigatus IBT 16806]PKX99053.1 transcriptional coactivator/pterin dehydratase [Aspergillus novofumigatus IBT 16806]